MRRILIVEDDDAMAVALREGFEYEGYGVLVARNGVSGLQQASAASIDLIILDVMLPEMSGLDLCQRLRGAGNTVPIIMVTARGQETDKVVGLKLGADDYVTKPFSFVELLARVEAVLRRTNRAHDTPDTVQFGDIVLQFSTLSATKGGRPLPLSAREFHILRYLVAHRGDVVTRDALLDAVWGDTTSPLTRTVDMHVAKLRKKIEPNPSDPQYIITLHRMGYKFMGTRQ